MNSGFANLDQTLLQLPSPLCVLDRDMNYIACTQEWLDQQNISEFDVIGKNIFDQSIPHRFDFSTFCPEYFARALSGQPQGSEIERFEQTDGEIEWISWTASPYRDSSQEIIGIVIGVNVVTRLKNLEEEITYERAKSIESAKLVALGEMAGGVAHEINTPLGEILLTAQVSKKILADSPNPDKVREDIIASLDRVSATSQRIAAIISVLRDISRDTSDGEESIAIDVQSFLSEIFSLCNYRAHNKDVLVKTHIDQELKERSVLLPKVQISQIMLNLMNNAFDEVHGLDERWVEVSVALSEETLLIKTKNSGEKIDPKLRDKIFQPFFTTKPLGKGTGLGLSLSRSMAERNGGKLYIDDDDPNTCFVIELPCQIAS